MYVYWCVTYLEVCSRAWSRQSTRAPRRHTTAATAPWRPKSLKRYISRHILYRIQYILTPYKTYLYTCVCIYTSPSTKRYISRYILYRIRCILTPYKIYIYTCVCIYTSSSPKEWIPWYILQPNRFVPTLYMTCMIHMYVIHIAITQSMHLLIYSSCSSIHSRALLAS